MIDTADVVVSLVQVKACPDTVRELKALLRIAESGELVGFAYVGHYRGGHFDADVVGGCRREPGFCLQMLRWLERKLDDVILPR